MGTGVYAWMEIGSVRLPKTLNGSDEFAFHVRFQWPVCFLGGGPPDNLTAVDLLHDIRSRDLSGRPNNDVFADDGVDECCTEVVFHAHDIVCQV
jgi:hypothetical protein